MIKSTENNVATSTILSQDDAHNKVKARTTLTWSNVIIITIVLFGVARMSYIQGLRARSELANDYTGTVHLHHYHHQSGRH